MDCLRVFYTVRHLRVRQIRYQVWYRVRRRLGICRVPAAGGGGDVRALCFATWVVPITKPTTWLGESRFCFLNQTQDCREASAWNQADFGKLWLYNLHYFDYLGQVPTPPSDLLDRWIAENPPGSGNGWEPYPTSLRIANWVKWHLQGHPLSESQRASLCQQTQWLTGNIEYHLLANHLWANAKALVFAGLFFQGDQAAQWLRMGLRLVKRELDEQILDDGGHFERSPMYHAIVLEDVLDLVNLFGVVNEKELTAALDADLRDMAERMLRWLGSLCHPDGRIAFFNDAALGIAPCLVDLTAYAQRLGVRVRADDGELGRAVTQWLPYSGFGRIQRGPFVMLADVGAIGPAYQPGHAHAEALAFEASVWSRRCFVNSGTSTYAPGADRHYQRSTAAHNGLVVDGLDSSEVWASHRVARRARVKLESYDNGSVSAAHDGFGRRSGLGEHKREWEVTESRMVIKDQVDGRGRHDVEVFYHVHPDWSVSVDGRREVVLSLKGEQKSLRLRVSGLDIEVQDSYYYPEFGKAVPNRTIRAYGTVKLPCEVVTVVEPEVLTQRRRDAKAYNGAGDSAEH